MARVKYIDGGVEQQPTRKVFETGALRENKDAVRFDLISPVGLHRLAMTYAEGAKRYGDRNWEKGMPASDVVNHLLAHINQWLTGDRTEDHLAHAAWGLFALMHFEKMRPNMIDTPTTRDMIAE